MADAFQPKFVDLVRNATTTTGTADFVLGPAPSGFTGFADAVQPGERFYYSAIGVDKPAEREVGRGTMQADGTIRREPVSGATTDFSSGTKLVSLIAAAEWFSSIQAAGAAAAGVAVAASRSALAALPRELPALLTESGREGLFVFDGSDLSARVAADPAQGIYIAPASAPAGSSGAWARKFDGPLLATWFGARGNANASGASGADDTAAIQAALDFLKARGGGGLHFPPGHYRCAGSLDVDHKDNIVLSGPAGQGAGYSLPPPAQLIYTGAGPRFLAARTTHALAIRDLGIRYTNAAFAGDLIDLSLLTSDTAYALVERCLAGGIDVRGARSIINLEGAILCSVIDNHLQWGQVGIRGRKEIAVENVLYSNAHVIERNTFDNLDVSALLNAGEGWTVNGNWFEGTGGGADHRSGMPRAYFDDISAASGAVTDGLTWHGNWHGDAVNVSDAWFCNGHTAIRGLSISGGFFDTSWSGAPGVKLTAGCEGVSITGTLMTGTVALANRNHNGVDISGNRFGSDVTGLSNDSCDVAITSNKLFGGFAKTRLRMAQVDEFILGTTGVTGSPGSYSFHAPPATGAELNLSRDAGRLGSMVFRTAGTPRWLFGVNNEGEFGAAGGSNFWVIAYDNAGGFIGPAMAIDRASRNATFGGTVTAANLSGTNTGDQTITLTGDVTGSGSAGVVATIADGAVTSAKLAAGAVSYAKLQNVSAGSRLLGRASAGAGSVEELGLAGGLAVAGGNLSLGAITPASVAAAGALTSSAAGAGVGYAAGAGGAVTQATSKSTAVTLNTVCGQITTNAAALASGALVVFTVNSSAVAASDTINLVLRSGNATAGTYRYWVEGIAAGSFKVVIENRSAGSLSEALVFTFAVMKAVAA